MKESKRRSLVKSLTWRLLGLLELFAEIYILAGYISNILILATLIPIIHFIVRFIEYYFHERLWVRISYGIIPEDLNDKQGRNKVGE